MNVNSSYFRGKHHFVDNSSTQHYLVFQPMCKYFKTIYFNNHISAWKSKGLSDESINFPSTPNNILNPLLAYVGTKRIVKFNGSCLKQDTITFNDGKTINIYTVMK